MSESKYFSISGDFEQLKNGYDGMEKVAGGAKLLGKVTFNVAKFALSEIAVPMVIGMAEKGVKHTLATSDDSERIERANRSLDWIAEHKKDND